MKKTFVQIREGAVSVRNDAGQCPLLVSYHAEEDFDVPGGIRYIKRHQDSGTGRIVVRTYVSKEEYDRNTHSAKR